MRVALLMVSCFVLGALAGCAQPAASSDPSSIDSGVDVRPTATTGVIKGVVVDPAIRPLSQAIVTVKAGGKTLTNTTNSNGGFGFAGLDPGTYFVVASKLGYVAGQTSVEVKANDADAPTVRLTLQALKGFVQPYAVADKHSGFIECGVGTAVVLVAVCAAPNLVAPISPDDFTHFISLDAGVPTWITGEMIWQSTQSFGDTLRIAVRSSTFEKWSGGTYIAGVNASTGPSPLHYAASTADIQKADLGNNATGLELDVFTANGVCDPVANTCVAGLTIEQKFEQITHIFYGFRPSADYRFTKDGEPKPPQ